MGGEVGEGDSGVGRLDRLWGKGSFAELFVGIFEWVWLGLWVKKKKVVQFY